MSEQKRGETKGFQHVDELPWTNGKATSLTGDPVDPKLLEVEHRTLSVAKEQLEQDTQPRCGNRGMTNFPIPQDDAFFVPGLDPDAVAPDGVDAAADDSNCPSGACKI